MSPVQQMLSKLPHAAAADGLVPSNLLARIEGATYRDAGNATAMPRALASDLSLDGSRTSGKYDCASEWPSGALEESADVSPNGSASVNQAHQKVDPLEVHEQLRSTCQNHYTELHAIVENAEHREYRAELVEEAATARVTQAAQEAHSLQLELWKAQEALARERMLCSEAQEAHTCAEGNLRTLEEHSRALLQDCNALKAKVQVLDSRPNPCNAELAALQRRVAELELELAESRNLFFL